MSLSISSNIFLKFGKKGIFIFINNKLIFFQLYMASNSLDIKDKLYTFLYVLCILYRFGLFIFD